MKLVTCLERCEVISLDMWMEKNRDFFLFVPANRKYKSNEKWFSEKKSKQKKRIFSSPRIKLKSNFLLGI
jgi:hypothetical protein